MTIRVRAAQKAKRSGYENIRAERLTSGLFSGIMKGADLVAL